METDNRFATSQRSVVQIGAALAVLVSAFLPWIGYGEPDSFELSAAFLWNPSAYRSWFSIGLVVLLAGLLVVSTVFVARFQHYRRRGGALVAGIAAIWQLQTFRGLVESYADVLHPLRDMVQSDFSVGPYVAFIAGMTLLIWR
jgi:hypothetical protein